MGVHQQRVLRDRFPVGRCRLWQPSLILKKDREVEEDLRLGRFESEGRPILLLRIGGAAETEIEQAEVVPRGEVHGRQTDRLLVLRKRLPEPVLALVNQGEVVMDLAGSRRAPDEGLEKGPLRAPVGRTGLRAAAPEQRRNTDRQAAHDPSIGHRPSSPRPPEKLQEQE